MTENRKGAHFPELRRALAGNQEALSALYRLEAALAPVLATVERYGRVWAKDTDYYAAAEVLGIKEPPENHDEYLRQAVDR